MTFSNFFELINNLNQDFQFYLKINNQEYPLSKITVAHNCYLAQTGKRAMSKKQIVKLFGKMHNRNSTFKMFINQKEYPIYGLHLSIGNKKASLM